ncbi:hypothetical protein VBI23_03565 [Streptococcus uberis]|uniref:hypothetical protein n=1 Tax=Streptococcus uberis TaxID=1349 RepID=UPI0037B2BB8F
MNFYMSVISIIVSVISIFISHYLGIRIIERKSKLDMERDEKQRLFDEKIENNKKEFENKKQIYNRLYIPLIKILLIDNEYAVYDYNQIVVEPYRNSGKSDQFLNLLIENIEIIPSSIIDEFKAYSYHTIYAMEFSKDKDRYKEISYNYCYNTFNIILHKLITEGSSLSIELGYSDHFGKILKQINRNSLRTNKSDNPAQAIYDGR